MKVCNALRGKLLKLENNWLSIKGQHAPAITLKLGSSGTWTTGPSTRYGEPPPTGEGMIERLSLCPAILGIVEGLTEFFAGQFNGAPQGISGGPPARAPLQRILEEMYSIVIQLSCDSERCRFYFRHHIVKLAFPLPKARTGLLYLALTL